MWVVIKTPCFPASYKVTVLDDRGIDIGSNATHNYFRDSGLAWKEAAARNKRLIDAGFTTKEKHNVD